METEWALSRGTLQFDVTLYKILLPLVQNIPDSGFVKPHGCRVFPDMFSPQDGESKETEVVYGRRLRMSFRFPCYLCVLFVDWGWYVPVSLPGLLFCVTNGKLPVGYPWSVHFPRPSLRPLLLSDPYPNHNVQFRWDTGFEFRFSQPHDILHAAKTKENPLYQHILCRTAKTCFRKRRKGVGSRLRVSAEVPRGYKGFPSRREGWN